MSEVALQALQIAGTQVGKEEVPRGSNWGEPVQSYLHSVGIDFPASWCMAFVYWCFQQTGKQHQLFKTGGVMMQFNKSRAYSVALPKPGNVFIMDFGKGLGHTGFVESVEGDYINTIEGNSNDEGSREGYEVCRRKRKISSIKTFLNF